MRPGVDAGTLSLYFSGRYDVHTRFRVANGSGTLIDLQGRYTRGSIELPNPLAPISSLQISLLREIAYDGSDSLAPFVGNSALNRLDDGATYSPLLQLGREVRFDVALTDVRAPRPFDLSSTWYELLRGNVSRISWPKHDSHIVDLTCLDLAGRLNIYKSETEYVYEAGTSLEVAIQAVLDNNGFSDVILHTPVPTGKVLTNRYAPGLQKTIWEQIWAIAQSAALVLWYRYDENNEPELTLFAPMRGKVESDMNIPILYDYQQLEINDELIRNVGYVSHIDESGKRVLTGPSENPASIAKYGGTKGLRRPFWIFYTDDSPVQHVEDALDILDAALSDSADPDAESASLTPPMVFGECSVDLYTFPSDVRFFDAPQKFAPFSITFDFAAETEYTSVMKLRGRPSAGTAWRNSAGNTGNTAPPLTAYDVVGLEYLGSTNGKRRYRVRLGYLVDQAEVYWGIFDSPEPSNWRNLLVDPNLGYVRGFLANDGDEFETDEPAVGKLLRGLVVPRARVGDHYEVSGRGWEFDADGTEPPIVIGEPEFTESSDGASSAFSLTIEDVRGVVSGVDIFMVEAGTKSGPFPALRAGNAYSFGFSLHPDHIIQLQVRIRRNDGGDDIWLGPYSSDTDKIPGIPVVHRGRVLDLEVVLVDGIDTDTRLLYYQEEVSGVPGAEVLIPARSSDPRFGSFNVTAGASERIFRIYARNGAGVAGQYREHRVEPYEDFATVAEVVLELNELQTYINVAFRDSVITQAEAMIIAEEIKQLSREKADIDTEYVSLDNNTDLVNPTKLLLQGAKTVYDTRHQELLDSINSAIFDSVITEEERLLVNLGFDNYRSSLAVYRQRYQEAIEAVKSRGDDRTYRPRIRVEIYRIGDVATVDIAISDPLKKLTAIEWTSQVQGASPTPVSALWTGATGTPGTDTVIDRFQTFAVGAGKDITVTFTATFTDEDGVAQTIADTLSLSNLVADRPRSIRIPPTAFVRQESTYDGVVNPDYFAPSTSGEQLWHGTAILPPGVVLTKVIGDLEREVGVTANPRLAVWRNAAGLFSVEIGFIDITGSGNQAPELVFSENVAENTTYVITYKLDKTGGFGFDPLIARGAKIEYVVPDFSKTY